MFRAKSSPNSRPNTLSPKMNSNNRCEMQKQTPPKSYM
uniref:Uncharacterized protein n=1 Tax=Rhizophora mucronata TaxID=61149 RepID=A0A2P2P590_RHIMU